MSALRDGQSTSQPNPWAPRHEQAANARNLLTDLPDVRWKSGQEGGSVDLAPPNALSRSHMHPEGIPSVRASAASLTEAESLAMNAGSEAKMNAGSEAKPWSEIQPFTDPSLAPLAAGISRREGADATWDGAAGRLSQPQAAPMRAPVGRHHTAERENFPGEEGVRAGISRRPLSGTHRTSHESGLRQSWRLSPIDEAPSAVRPSQGGQQRRSPKPTHEEGATGLPLEDPGRMRPGEDTAMQSREAAVRVPDNANEQWFVPGVRTSQASSMPGHNGLQGRRKELDLSQAKSRLDSKIALQMAHMEELMRSRYGHHRDRGSSAAVAHHADPRDVPLKSTRKPPSQAEAASMLPRQETDPRAASTAASQAPCLSNSGTVPPYRTGAHAAAQGGPESTPLDIGAQMEGVKDFIRQPMLWGHAEVVESLLLDSEPGTVDPPRRRIRTPDSLESRGEGAHGRSRVARRLFEPLGSSMETLRLSEALWNSQQGPLWGSVNVSDTVGGAAPASAAPRLANGTGRGPGSP